MKQTIIPSLKKGLQVLEVVTNAPNGIPVDQIHKGTRIPRTTLVRILNTLESSGYVLRVNRHFFASAPSGQPTRPTPSELRKLAMPHLRRLLDLTGETVELGIHHNGTILYLAKLENAKSSIKMLFEEGKHYGHMHASGICKVLLAYLDKTDVVAVLERDGMTRYTPKTLTSRPRLFKDLQRIRDQKGHIESEENRIGVKRISVPVLAHTRLLGAVGYVGPVSHVRSNLSDKRILNEVKKTANIIAKELTP